MNFADFLPPGVTIDDAITALFALTTLALVMAIWSGLVARDTAGTRVRALADRRAVLKGEAVAPNRRSRQELTIGVMRNVVQKLNLIRGQKTEALRLKLARAGWRSKDAMIAYLFFKVFLPLAFGVAAGILLIGINLYGLPAPARFAGTILAVVIGAYMPEILVKNATDKRQNQVRKALPDALDLLVICAEAGLSLDAAFTRVAREMGRSAPELADEFGLTAIELGFLPERRQALVNLNQRTDLPSIRGMVNTLIQTERYGTPLAQSLRVLANEFRQERLMRAEEKAARLPAIMTVPMIVFILPALFVVLIGPAIVRTIDTFLSQ